MKLFSTLARTFMCATCLYAAAAQAQPLAVTSLLPGYTSESYNLDAPFAGAIAPVSESPHLLYVNTGNFGSQEIMLLNTDTETTTIVASGFGNIGGMVCLPGNQLIISENFTSDSLFLARDLNSDDDFHDPNEITSIIAPILHDGDFTGAQLAIAPPGNASGLPAGALLIQTADGGTSGELLAVESPLTAPAYRPPGQAYFSGIAYNGGVDFDLAGNVIMGSSSFPDASVTALVNTDQNEQIGPGESHVIIPSALLPASIADLAISAENLIYITENSGTLRRFTPPANLLSGQATGEIFAETNGLYLSCLRFDDKTAPFTPHAGNTGATLWIGGYTNFVGGATNLVAIRPAEPSSVDDWNLYN